MECGQFKMYNAIHLCMFPREPNYGSILRDEYYQLAIQPDVDACGAFGKTCYVDGFKNKKKFICCQSATSVTDFYDTLWTERSYLVVSLSEPENNENQYWNTEENGVLQAGQYQIRTIKSKVFDNCVAVELHLSNEVEPCRQLCYLSFRDWTENDVPRDVAKFFEFVRRVNHLQSKIKKAGEIQRVSIGPIVLYSSKGNNRTGTFCVADFSLYEMNKTAWISLQRIVTNIRRQLNSIVVTAEQYLFCYRVVRHSLTKINMNTVQNSNEPEDDKENLSPPSSASARKIQVQPEDLYYDMSGEKHLIILNHHTFKKTQYFGFNTPSTRNGTYKDAVRLKQVFQKLGFTVKEHNDLEHREIVTMLNTIINTDYSATSCIAFAILSHGDKGDEIYAADRPYNLQDIVRVFDQNTTLIGKPKLFFVQACRGKSSDSGRYVSTDGHGRAGNTGYLLPSRCDTLIIRSCIENFYSYRNEGGSWLIQELVNAIEKYHDTRDFVQICMIAQNNVATNRATYHYIPADGNKKQMPETSFTLIKLLML